MNPNLPVSTLVCLQMTSGNPRRWRGARFAAIVVLAFCSAAPFMPVLSAASKPAKQRNVPGIEARIDKILGSSAAGRGFWGIEVAELPGDRFSSAVTRNTFSTPLRI